MQAGENTTRTLEIILWIFGEQRKTESGDCMPIKNYTSTQNPLKTASEIESLLILNGAKSIQKDISGGKITAIKFLVDTAIGEVPISLPVRVSAAYEILKQQKKKNPRIKADPEQAERTAWKCLKDWVDAQMALIQLGLANMDEVFMPYITDRNGNTLYEIAKERRFLLEGGNRG